ncbi:MAG: S8 family serine peptidase [Candidatus Hydrogenedentes bacterium]|nr:S8 family serine peptidase [Candidatus Hydrogenedentota bacterium]
MVSRVRVHHEITHTWIGDLECKLYNSTHTWMLRDNAGGSADNVNETLDEYTLFDGDNPSQSWYYRVRDIVGGDAGTLTVMQLYVYYNIPEVNLLPYRPSSWSDKIVASKVTGTNTDDSLTAGDTIYVDWAVLNSGSTATAAVFYSELYVDGTLRGTWYTNPPLNANYYAYVVDYPIGTLSAGSHTLRILADSTGVISETNESDNEYTKTISVAPLSAANLTPFRPSAWSDKIVASKVTGTHTDDSLTANDTVYVDWAVLNDGSAATATTFYTALYLDGTLQASWFSNPPLNVNYYAYAEDYPIGTLSAGDHTLRIVADSTNVVPESSELDNEYTKTISVAAGDPEIRIAPLTLELDCSAGAKTVAEDSVWETPMLPGEPQIALDEIVDTLTTETVAEVLVVLKQPLSRMAATQWKDTTSLKELQAEVQSLEESVLVNIPASELTVKYQYENFAGFWCQISPVALQLLVDDPSVLSIQPVRPLEPHLAQGIPLMNASATRGTYNGQGLAIAVCDTGIDYTHPRLGSGSFPNAKILGGYDFGDGDADPMPNGQPHGTACAGIAAGNTGTTGDYIGGVAYGAKLYALKISYGTAGSAYDSAMIAAWDWCVSHRNDDPNNPILVISTSFGGGRFFSACDGESAGMTLAANNAVAAGITVLASSGNDGYCDSMGWPACISNVLSVGAVYDANFGTYQPCVNAASCGPKLSTTGCATGWYAVDNTAADLVTAYSNSASFLGVFGPSNRAYTLDIAGAPGYGSGDYTSSFGGTSAACPYVAGAVAALQSAAKTLTGSYLTVPQVRNLLTATGDLVTDSKVAITKPRVNLGAAIATLTQNSFVTIYNDGSGPLTVSSVAFDAPAPWITILTQFPALVPQQGSLIVPIGVNCDLAPDGSSTRRLLVYSNDADENPYPNGIYITVNNTAPPAPALTLTAPNGGESWTQGSTHDITWTSTDIPGGVTLKLELLKAGVFYSTIDAGVENDGVYSWTIPSLPSADAACDFQVMISWLADESVNDLSDAPFCIESNGSLKVVLQPSAARDAGAMWCLDGGDYHVSHFTLTGIAPGAHMICFKAVSGWTTPPDQPVQISSGQLTYASGQYVSGPVGALKFRLFPAGARYAGAMWRVDGGAWRPSHATVQNLTPGTHRVTFKTIPCWVTPLPQDVTIVANETLDGSATYQPVTTGAVKVRLIPTAARDAGALWWVDDRPPRLSHSTETGLEPGPHTLHFLALPGWCEPEEMVVDVVACETLDVFAEYRRLGALKVMLLPDAVRDAGARWRLDGGAWWPSHKTLFDLCAGPHWIEFQEVAGWQAPPAQTVEVLPLQTAFPLYTYIRVDLTVATADNSGEGEAEDIAVPALKDLAEEILVSFASADTNQDGLLDFEEVEAHLESLSAAQFESLDRNADGAITEEELLAAAGVPGGCHSNSRFLGFDLLKILDGLPLACD